MTALLASGVNCISLYMLINGLGHTQTCFGLSSCLTVCVSVRLQFLHCLTFGLEVSNIFIIRGEVLSHLRAGH